MGIAQINTKKIDLEKVIANSSLSDDQKDLWFDFISKIIEEDIVSVLDALRDDSNTLSFLTKNLQSKLDAIKAKDAPKWEEIMKDQKSHLDKQ